MNEYSPGRLWSILVGDVPASIEEETDIRVALAKLPVSSQVFVFGIAHGYTVKDAMKRAGLVGNQTRVRQDILMSLWREINGQVTGVRNGHKISNHQHRSDVRKDNAG